MFYTSQDAADTIHADYLALLDDWPVPHQRHHLNTGQGQTFVIECGNRDAPPVVLLHGSMGTAVGWYREVQAWAPHFRLFVVDIIGEPGLSAQVRPELASDAHANWLDEVLDLLRVERAAFAGISLGGWFSLDYAIRRRQRVSALALQVPGGIGGQKNILWWAIPLFLLGPWGIRKVTTRILGPANPDPTPAEARFIDLIGRIGRSFRGRRVALPMFGDADLAAISVPVMAVVAGRDVLLDPVSMKARLEAHVPQLDMHYLPDARHYPGDQSAPVLAFLQRHLTSG